MDRRLVKTLLGLVMAIVEHRHRNNGLLLSELGVLLLGARPFKQGENGSATCYTVRNGHQTRLRIPLGTSQSTGRRLKSKANARW